MFELGDKIVCVDDVPVRGTKGWDHPENIRIKKGGIYVILAFGDPVPGGPLKGKQTLILNVSVPHDGGYCAFRFRKLKKADEEFKQLIKSFDPAKKRNKQNV